MAEELEACAAVLNTLLSAGAARLHDNGRITALGTGAMFRAVGVLAN